jgi:feruloyl esterase
LLNAKDGSTLLLLKVRFTPLLLVCCFLPAHAAPAIHCEALLTTSFGKDVKIQSAKTIAKSDSLPEYCDVRGTIWPEDKFAVYLPTDWNKRFNMVGNGGSAGVISLGAMQVGLKRGFATASTDMGHDDEKEPGAIFAYPSATNPEAERKAVDFGYLATHETTVMAKNIINVYYGQNPSKSYYVGCSTGGRQGLMEAQRYPDDFDGLVVGATVLNHTGTLLRHIWNAQAVQEGAGAISPAKMPALAKAVYGKCDALDGLEDGIIEDPLRCNFDPAADLPKCDAGKDSPDCFTAPQIAALRKVYGGVKDSSGKRLFFGQLPGAEIAVKGPNGLRAGWDGNVVGASAGLKLADSYMKYMLFTPPAGPNWDWRKFNFDTDPAKIAVAGRMVNATDPDLRKLKARGAKVIHYHGWADPMVSPLMSLDYYMSVRKTMGDKATDDFYRFFPIPGMFHCRGGPGCSQVDWLTPIVAWVEEGKAPEILPSAHVEGGATTLTRPLCRYPFVAKYKGSGDVKAAENFSCEAQPEKPPKTMSGE